MLVASGGKIAFSIVPIILFPISVILFTKAIISFLIVGIITKFENVVFIKFILNANENISCVMISISLAESCLPLFPTVFSITVFSLSF